MTNTLDSQITKQDQYLIYGALTFDSHFPAEYARMVAKLASPKIVEEIKSGELTAQRLAWYCEEILGTDSGESGYADDAIELFMLNYERSGDYRAVMDTQNMLVLQGKLKPRLPQSSSIINPYPSPNGHLEFAEDNHGVKGLVKRLLSPFRKYVA